MKVICGGLSKTGTKTLAKALRILGYTVYDYSEHRDFHMDEWFAIHCEGKAPDFTAMYKDVDAVTDLPAATWFQEIYESFPDAKVILSVRDNEEVWVKSFSKQMEILNTLGGFVNRISLIWLAPMLGMILAPITTVTQVKRTRKELLFGQTIVTASYRSLNSKSTSKNKKKNVKLSNITFTEDEGMERGTHFRRSVQFHGRSVDPPLFSLKSGSVFLDDFSSNEV